MSERPNPGREDGRDQTRHSLPVHSHALHDASQDAVLDVQAIPHSCAMPRYWGSQLAQPRLLPDDQGIPLARSATGAGRSAAGSLRLRGPSGRPRVLVRQDNPHGSVNRPTST